MKATTLLADIATGAIAGYVGTKIMGRVSMKLYKLEGEQARQQEEAVRPGPPYQIAAKKTLGVLGVRLNDKQLKTAGQVFHYGLGMSWGATYPLLRRYTDLNPAAAGLLSGAAMSLIVDEGLTPALGFSAPNAAYPPVTHARAIVNHLAFGLGVAAAVESLGWLGREGSTSRRGSRA